MNHVINPTRSLRLALLVLAAALLLPVPAAPAAEQPAKSWQQIETPPLPPQEVPKPRREVLDNGMVVMLLEDHELPLVEATALIRTGSRDEPAAKVGLARLAGDVMRSGGTASMSPDELNQFLENRAASIETGIDTAAGSASMSALAEDFPEVLEVFADVLRSPAFAEDQLAVAKNQLNTAISRQNDDPQQIAFREFSKLIYGEDSPYARDETYETVTAVTRQDLVDWHQRSYHPDRVVLGLVGDFDSDRALALVREAFGDWPRGPAADLELPDVALATSPGVYRVEKNDMTQSNIVMGHLGIEKDNPDYYAVEAMNNILSGSFASRLFSNVRSAKGLAYAVFGSVGSNYDYPGVFTMFTTTKTETTGAAIEALLEEARNLTAKPPTADELAKAKEAILNSFVFESDSTREILGQQVRYEYFGYPLDWLERYRKGIDTVTLEEVRAAAAKYVHPDDLRILVVGPTEGLDKPLTTYGEVTQVDISIPEPAAETAEVTEEGRARAAELLARAVAAMGGPEVVDAVAALRSRGAASQQTPAGAMDLQVASTLVFPDRLRQELTLPMGSITMVLSGESGFMISPQGAMDLPGSQAAALRRAARRDPLALLKTRNDDNFTATALPPVEVEGTPLERLQLEIDGDVTLVDLDPESGLIRRIVYRDQGPAGAPGEVVRTFSDYREVDGLTYPFAVVGTFEGEPLMSSQVEELEVDPEIDEADFERPAP
jgi:predicted Zn-dependent peptidase